ncbi:hypothetical protein VP01_354g1 [Puccinia sorghi]|uniref:Uncharacterized protein n=1 Tax=Puccinia sorghi TaxID=27349 RepID=A0A0L6UVE1_9BASI|nr:hypothetical protein VP01_354g1 [Puccinia sorghi]
MGGGNQNYHPIISPISSVTLLELCSDKDLAPKLQVSYVQQCQKCNINILLTFFGRQELQVALVAKGRGCGRVKRHLRPAKLLACLCMGRGGDAQEGGRTWGVGVVVPLAGLPSFACSTDDSFSFCPSRGPTPTTLPKNLFPHIHTAGLHPSLPIQHRFHLKPLSLSPRHPVPPSHSFFGLSSFYIYKNSDSCPASLSLFSRVNYHLSPSPSFLQKLFVTPFLVSSSLSFFFLKKKGGFILCKQTVTTFFNYRLKTPRRTPTRRLTSKQQEQGREEGGGVSIKLVQQETTPTLWGCIYTQTHTHKTLFLLLVQNCRLFRLETQVMPISLTNTRPLFISLALCNVKNRESFSLTQVVMYTRNTY